FVARPRPPVVAARALSARSVRLRLIVLIALGSLGMPSAAAAQAVRVTLVRRPNAVPAAVETLVRLQGELSSIGVEAVFAGAEAADRLRALVGQGAGQPAPAAAGATEAVVDVNGDP